MTSPSDEIIQCGPVDLDSPPVTGTAWALLITRYASTIGPEEWVAVCPLGHSGATWKQYESQRYPTIFCPVCDAPRDDPVQDGE